MTDQEQQLLDFSSQDLALLLKQTILTFCQMNVAYKNKLEVVGSIHIKADEVEVSSFLLQENCRNRSDQVAQSGNKSDEDFENVENALKDGVSEDAGETDKLSDKVEDTFCIVNENGDEQDSKSDNGEGGSNETAKKDEDTDNENMETESTAKDGDDTNKDKDADGDSEKTISEKAESVKTDDGKDEETDSKKDSSSPAGPQASIAKQLTGASLATAASMAAAGPRQVALMVNGTHPMIRAGMPMIRHSNVPTSSSMSISNSAMGPRIPMPHAQHAQHAQHAAMAAAMNAAQMGLHPHPMFIPSHHHQVAAAQQMARPGGAVPTHLSARAAIESIYRQNPPLTNRTVNLAAGGVMRHPSLAARGGAMIRQMPGLHMMQAPPRPTGGLVCPLCMATCSSQDQYLRHLSSHQRSSVF